MTTRIMPVATNNDAELVGGTLAGNRDAFTQIVARYQSLICSLAYSATGSLGQSEDLAQEISSPRGNISAICASATSCALGSAASRATASIIFSAAKAANPSAKPRRLKKFPKRIHPNRRPANRPSATRSRRFSGVRSKKFPTFTASRWCCFTASINPSKPSPRTWI